MKSILGLVLTIGVTLLFFLANYEATRAGASWMDGQWVFGAALPYNEIALKLTGETNFSPDSTVQLLYAWLVDDLLAYIIGALIEAIVRLFYRQIRRLRRRA